MKKSIIAAGAASVALAAMPIVSTFATDVVTTDNIKATISEGCTITDAALSKNVNMSVAPGNVATSTAAPSISVTCNKGGWYITAKGSTTVPSGSSLAVTDLIAEKTGETTTYVNIPTGTDTVTNSSWAFKVADLSDETNASIVTTPIDYSAFASVPATTTNIVAGSAASTETVYIQYQVFAKVGQTPGSYEGQVTYSVTDQGI